MWCSVIEIGYTWRGTYKQAIAEKFGDYLSTVVGMTYAGDCVDGGNDVCGLMNICD